MSRKAGIDAKSTAGLCALRYIGKMVLYKVFSPRIFSLFQIGTIHVQCVLEVSTAHAYNAQFYGVHIRHQIFEVDIPLAHLHAQIVAVQSHVQLTILHLKDFAAIFSWRPFCQGYFYPSSTNSVLEGLFRQFVPPAIELLANSYILILPVAEVKFRCGFCGKAA